MGASQQPGRGKPTLKSLLKKGELLIAPGIFDGMSLRLAEKVGFQVLYMTGFGTVGSHLGLQTQGSRAIATWSSGSELSPACPRYLSSATPTRVSVASSMSSTPSRATRLQGRPRYSWRTKSFP